MIRTAVTENGVVRGLPAADPRITSFKGIPFAAPATGKNRWRAPQPVENWEGELECFNFSPVPYQAPASNDDQSIYHLEWSVDPHLPMGEDCLTLNVWMPAAGQQNMPVFVWFFGGGLQVGHTAEMEFDGERIARRDIVVVTVNYRVNVFGFLAHPELTKEAPEAPTNFGFLDQQAALKWVKRNIKAFGGDPDNVTIGGQSAGGMGVCAQLSAPSSKGLFNRAIIESGAFAAPYPFEFGLTKTMEEAENNGVEFFKFLGVETLEEARAIDGLTLRNKMLEYEGIKGWAQTWGEVVDGVFSMRNSQEWMIDPAKIHCPIMLGHTSNEFQVTPMAKTKEELEKIATELAGDEAGKIMACFSEPVTEDSIKRDGEICSIEFGCRVAAHVNGSEAEPVDMYYYNFDTTIPGWDNPGCFHSVDLWFFFETLAKCWRPFKGEAYDLACSMCDYWCNFIKTGNPNGKDLRGDELPVWKTYTEAEPNRISFRKVPEPELSPNTDLVDILIKCFLKRKGASI